MTAIEKTADMTALEVKEAKMAELKEKAEAIVARYNDAAMHKDLNALGKEQDTLNDVLKDYAGTSKMYCYLRCMATPDPMLTAVKLLSYPMLRVKKIEDDRDKDIPRIMLDYRDAIIDIGDFNKRFPIGKDSTWTSQIASLAVLLACSAAHDLGHKTTEVNDSYHAVELQKQFDEGKTPDSTTQVEKYIDGILMSMLGEGYKCLRKDAKALKHSLVTKDGRMALTFNISKVKRVRQVIFEIAHRVVMNKEYNIRLK